MGAERIIRFTPINMENHAFITIYNHALSQLEQIYTKSEAQTLLRFLLAHLKIPHTANLAAHSPILSATQLTAWNTAIAKFLAQMPWQYVLGECDFAGLTLQVNQSVLIPRPETEELVAFILQNHGSEAITIHDACTGSGCIALALQAKRPNWSIFATDVSIEALALAQLNAKNLNLKTKFSLFDVLLEEQFSTKTHVWVANPPYVHPDEQIEMLERVLAHEPHLALFAPAHNVLLFYQKITQLAYKSLEVNGDLYFEVHEKYAIETANLVSLLGFKIVALIKDMQGKNRILHAKKCA